MLPRRTTQLLNYCFQKRFQLSYFTIIDSLIWSSCHIDSPWVKGSGAPIQSWLKSVVYHYDDEKATKSNSTFAEFSSYYVTDGHMGDNTYLDKVEEIGNRNSRLRWRKFGPGFWDGWLYGDVDSDGEFSGNDVAYIFADLTTVIYGKFRKGVLIEGKARKVKGYR